MGSCACVSASSVQAFLAQAASSRAARAAEGGWQGRSNVCCCCDPAVLRDSIRREAAEWPCSEDADLPLHRPRFRKAIWFNISANVS